jgi:hypothetical protein
MKWACFAIGLPLLCLMMGCSSSPYVDGYLFMPRPAMADVPGAQPTVPAQVSAIVSIVGIREADKKLGLPESIEVRLRMDNNGPETVTFDPRSMQLTTGVLVDFPPAIIRSSAPAMLRPGESAFATAYFPFPGGQSYDSFDLQSLQLRWTLLIGNRPVQQVANFQQVYRRYYGYYGEPYGGPYWGPYPYYPGPFVGGVIIVHRR